LYAIGLLASTLQEKAAMLICCDENRRVIYVTPEGDLLAKEAESMHKQVQEYARHDMDALVLDLARVRTIDPFGLHTILLLYNQLCKSKGELIIENASRELKTLFQLMRIDGRLTISQTGWPS
jgi:anti-anti-sigma factor